MWKKSGKVGIYRDLNLRCRDSVTSQRGRPDCKRVEEEEKKKERRRRERRGNR